MTQSKKHKNERPPIIHIVSLGCAKNLVDTERFLGVLLEAGFSLADDVEQADIAFVNTCGFIADARDETVEVLRELVSHKGKGSLRAVVALGCMVENNADELRKLVPTIDGVWGFSKYNNIVNSCYLLLKRKCAKKNASSFLDAPRLLLGSPVSSYLKISEGCDIHCTFCSIPSIRGPQISIPIEDLVNEASDLVASGVRELTLIAQETADYGRDLYNKRCLPELINELGEIEGLDWIRIMYTHPKNISDELIDLLHNHPRVVPYLDMPIQHASKSVLERMGRGMELNDLENLVKKLRSGKRKLFLRSTVLVGFPGETEKDFAELLAFLKTAHFERLGAFAYSPEPNTPAFNMDNKVPEDVAKERLNAVMTQQQELAFQTASSLVGQSVPVILEAMLEEDGLFSGRTIYDAQEVDGCIKVKNVPDDADCMITAKVTNAIGYDTQGTYEGDYIQ